MGPACARLTALADGRHAPGTAERGCRWPLTPWWVPALAELARHHSSSHPCRQFSRTQSRFVLRAQAALKKAVTCTHPGQGRALFNSPRLCAQTASGSPMAGHSVAMHIDGNGNGPAAKTTLPFPTGGAVGTGGHEGLTTPQVWRAAATPSRPARLSCSSTASGCRRPPPHAHAHAPPNASAAACRRGCPNLPRPRPRRCAASTASTRSRRSRRPSGARSCCATPTGSAWSWWALGGAVGRAVAGLRRPWPATPALTPASAALQFAAAIVSVAVKNKGDRGWLSFTLLVSAGARGEAVGAHSCCCHRQVPLPCLPPAHTAIPSRCRSSRSTWWCGPATTPSATPAMPSKSSRCAAAGAGCGVRRSHGLPQGPAGAVSWPSRHPERGCPHDPAAGAGGAADARAARRQVVPAACARAGAGRCG